MNDLPAMAAPLPLSISISDTDFHRNLMDALPDIVSVIDTQGHFIYLNAAGYKKWKLSLVSLTQTCIWEIIAGEDRTSVKEELQKLSSNQLQNSVYMRCTGCSGQPENWMFQKQSDSDTFLCIVKEAENKFPVTGIPEYPKTSETSGAVSEIFHRITDGFLDLDENWIITYINPKAEEIVRDTYGDVLHRNLWECFPGLLHTPFYENYHKAIKENTVVHFESYFAPLKAWFEVNAYPSQKGLQIFFRDISSRKNAEEALRMSNERFQLAAKNDAIYDWDLLTNNLQWGEGLKDLFGYHPEELQMNEWEAALLQEDREMVVHSLYEAMEDPKASIWKCEYRFKRKDGSCSFVLERGHILRNQEGKAIRMVGTMRDITERKSAENERKQYEDKIKSQHHMMVEVLEQMGDGFLTMTFTGKVIYWNQEAEKITGIPRERTLGKSLWDVYPGIEDTAFFEIYKDLIQTKKPLHREMFSPFGNRWIELHAYTTHNGISAFFRDITVNRQIKEELRILSLIARETVNPVWLMDTSMNICWINDAFIKTTGFIPHEVIGKQPSAFFKSTDPTGQKDKEITGILEAGKTFQGDFIHYTKDKQELYVRLNAQPILDAEDRINQYFVMVTDLTENKKTEAHLKRLSLVAKETEDGVIFMTPSSEIIWVNDAFTRMTGYSLEEAKGNTPSKLLTGPQTDPQTIDFAKEMFRKAIPFEVEFFNYKKDGSPFWSSVHVQPLFDEQGQVVQYFSLRKDISERKKLEEELEQQRKQITAAVISAQENERAQIGRELHDNVNQVLTTVKLYQELCLSGIGSSNELLKKSMDLLQESINEIRSLSKRLSAPSLGNIKLVDSVRELVEAVEATGKLTITLEADRQIDVDQEVHLSLYRILQEHLTNILKHAEAQRVNVSIETRKNMLLLKVKDDGRGFDLEKKRKGIGITNMTTRAESLKGYLDIKTGPGHGCELIVSLPLSVSFSSVIGLA